MERQKELDAQRNEEQNRKLVKVQSIKVGGTIDHSSQNPNFKDPVATKFHQAKDDSPREVSKPSSTAQLTDEEAQSRAEAEMARINKTLKRGGHQV